MPASGFRRALFCRTAVVPMGGRTGQVPGQREPPRPGSLATLLTWDHRYYASSRAMTGMTFERFVSGHLPTRQTPLV